MLGEEEIVAPALWERCGGDSGNPEARRISVASKGRLLKCAVCGVAVKKVFGTKKRWHFARFPGAPSCDHENETVEHRESKFALYHALKSRLPSGWSVHLEKRLENDRRPDVLASNEGGVRVAFEVQYADLSEKDWRMRHEDYAKLGVRDVWMLGHAREGNRRDALANVLATTAGQRILYIGQREGERNVRAREAIFGIGLPHGEVPYAKPGTASPGAFIAGWPGACVAEWVEYGLGAIKLLEDGTPRTPADFTFERLSRKAEWERQQEERRRKDAEERRRKEAEREAKSAAEVERRRKWGEERRSKEARAWKESLEREKARRILGDHVMKLLESEGSLDKNIYRPAGQWKTAFFLARIHGRPPDTVFDWFKAAGSALLQHPHNERDRGKWAWAALHAFIDRLAWEGFVEFDHCDDRGLTRYWRTPLSREQREKLIAKQAEKNSRREEEERREAEGASRREAKLEEKWQLNRRKREAESEAREQRTQARISTPISHAHPPTSIRLDREQLLERQERLGQWLVSRDRQEARAELGQSLFNRLEREEDFDRAMLTHPGEWKVWIFRNFIHDEAPNVIFDVEETISKVLRRFQATGDPSLADEAVKQFVLLLCREGFLAATGAISGPEESQRSYTVIGTATEWTQRLNRRLGRSQDKLW